MSRRAALHLVVPGLVAAAGLAASPGVFATSALREGAAPAGPSRLAQAYEDYSRAQQALLTRDYASALDLMERAAARDGAPDLLLELAQLRFSLNQLDQAASLAQHVAASRPDLAEASKLLGDIDLSRAREGSDPEANVGHAVEHYRAALAADPTSASTCQSLAELLYQTGRVEEAGKLLHGFAQSQPLDPALSLLLGKIDVRTRRYEEAEQILVRILDRAAGNLEAADALAALYEFEEKYDKAIDVYTDLLRSMAPTAYLRDRIGSLHLRAGRFKEAIAALEDGQRIDPADTAGLLALAQAREGTGEMKEALGEYDRAIQREPDNLEARFYRARLQDKEGDRAAALAGFRGIVELSAGRGAVTDREAMVLSLSYSQIGLIEMESHDYEAAAEAFTRAMDASDEPGAELFVLLARARLEGGKTEDAQAVMIEGQKRFPEDLDLKILHGETLVAKRQVLEARRFFATLLSDQGNKPETYAQISEALLRQKRFEEAESILKEGTRRHPESDGLFFARGAAVERLGRIGEAERYLARAIRLNPKNAMALNYLGYMLADRGVKLTESIAYVERALEIDPRNPAYLDSLGWAQYKLSLFEPAEKNLREALRYDRGDPTIMEHLGDLLMITGRIEEAVQEWESALAHGHEESQRLRDKMERARATLKDRK